MMKITNTIKTNGHMSKLKDFLQIFAIQMAFQGYGIVIGSPKMPENRYKMV